jgi:hypothetical protein
MVNKIKKNIQIDHKEKITNSVISTPNWKFWFMLGLTIFWCVLFGFAVVNNSKKTSMARWWAEQIKAEGKPLSINDPLRAIQKNHAPIPYVKVGDYYQLNFDVLSSFPSDTPPLNNPRIDPRIKTKPPTAQVPPTIQALDGEKISVAGFMIPMITDKDKVSSFILAQTRGSCCYGLTPKLNQWIYVEMNQGKTVETSMDVPITVSGTLMVSKDLNTQDKSWCLYRMQGERIDLPSKSWF